MKSTGLEKKMKIGFNKLALAITLLVFAAPTWAAGTIIAVTVLGLTAGTFAAAAVAFAINMVISAVISKAFFSPNQPSGGDLSASSPNPGNRQQVPPATDNKLPVVYGSAYVGGTIVDLSITGNNQKLYYVLAISEVTNTNQGQTPDQFTFGDVYYGGKKCIFGTAGAEYTLLQSGFVAVGSNYIQVDSDLSASVPSNTQITFSDQGTPTIYTVSSFDTGTLRIYFTTNIAGVTTSSTAYIYNYIDNRAVVTGLLDESTNETDTAVNGKINIYLYTNGSNSPYNSTQSAISLMNSSGLDYTWDNSKLMTNCAFAIIQLTYSQSANIRGIEQTKFQINNPRNSAGDCFYDYLINTRYGAAIPESQINTASLTALNVYGNQNFTYTTYSGSTTTQPRFKFNGTIDTNRSILDNLGDMASCCDCLLKYNEVTAKWGVIVQTPAYTSAMDITNDNMISAISISPLDIAASYNVIECKFPDNENQDAFNAATFDLAEIAPSLLYPNEPVNKLTMSLPLVNNDVQAQYIANRVLKSAREDLIVQVDINFVGIQLDAGDVVTVTSANYGWDEKLFRLSKVTQTFTDDGAIIVKLTMSEYNPTVYDDVAITQFAPAPNSGIGSPLFFGSIPRPLISSISPSAAIPFFNVSVQTPRSGIVQYAEIWYSAFQFPNESQRLFAGTTQIQASGNPYPASASIPPVSLTNIPSGNWYFFTRMVNSLGRSIYSPASVLVVWQPQSYQFVERYLSVVYADTNTGTGLTTNPRNKAFYGLANVSSANLNLTVSDYTWYEAKPEPFGSENYLIYLNQGSRRFTFAVDNAAYIGIGGNFVPTETSVYDPTIWSGLPDGTNTIDLDKRTGQVTKVGTTSQSVQDGLLSVTNNTQGTMIVSLQKFLNFGNGIYSKNFAPASLTIDVYGRVVGFSQEDNFYFSDEIFAATAGQTSFAVTHIVGDILVFRNGVLIPTADYTETTTTVVLNNACAAGEIVEILNMRAVSTDVAYIDLGTTLASLQQAIAWLNNSSATITWTNSASATIGWQAAYTYSQIPYNAFVAGDQVTFANTGSPTVYTIASVDYTTRILTFTTSVTGVAVGDGIYDYRAAGATYSPFERYEIPMVGVTAFTPTSFTIRNGFEQIYVNGSQFNEIDYDLNNNELTGFPAPITGTMDLIIFNPNNLGIPCSNITNTVAYSIANSLSYAFPNNPLAMQVYANGTLFVKGSSYDYVPNSSGYNLINAIPNNFTILNQQTLARIGAA